MALLFPILPGDVSATHFPPILRCTAENIDDATTGYEQTVKSLNRNIERELEDYNRTVDPAAYQSAIEELYEKFEDKIKEYQIDKRQLEACSVDLYPIAWLNEQASNVVNAYTIEEEEDDPFANERVQESVAIVERAGGQMVDAETTTKEVQQGGEGEGGCLIATASFGSELAPQVQLLREIRDNVVLNTATGSAFMSGFNQIYYSFSPQIADLERENLVFQQIVKITITPLITSLSLLNHVDINSEVEMLAYGIGIISLNIGMYFVAPAIVISKLVNRRN